jgi:hypothetical protein
MEPVGDVLDGVAVERPVHGDAGAGFAGASTLQSGWRERERRRRRQRREDVGRVEIVGRLNGGETMTKMRLFGRGEPTPCPALF